MTCVLRQTIRSSPLALAMWLAACGGGGSVSSAPPAPVPTPTPTPTPTPPPAPVTFIDAPATSQEFAAFTSGESLRIRYDAQSRTYEVMAPGQGWGELRAHPSNVGQFEFALDGPSSRLARFHPLTRSNYIVRYHYSSLASWSRDVSETDFGASGVIAFGTATPAGGVPVTGSASYLGVIEGSASNSVIGYWGDKWARAPIAGEVSLRFDFGKGSLAGEMRPLFICDCGLPLLPRLSFTDTAFAVGGRDFSGRFAAGASGPNAFSGIFTGPNAEELIGKWTFPFLLDGAPQSAEGAWVAKRGD